MRKRFFTVMAAALVVSGMPVMAKETSTEEKISEAVEETKDSTEAESVVSGNEDRISQIHDLEKQIAVLKEERKQLRESNVTEIGDVIYQDESVIITYNGIKEDEYGDGYSINFITENLTDKKIIVQYEDASLNDFMFYAVYSANLAPNKQFWMAILMMRFVYLIRLQLVLNKQMHSVIYRGSKKKLLQKSIMRDMIT